MATGTPANYDPKTNGAQNSVVRSYICPADPSMTDGIVTGGKLGGSSYAANAQVFAPLTNEKLLAMGGRMNSPDTPNYCDRGAPLARIMDGTSNTIFFTHAYAQCGPGATGSAWGYTEGINAAPSTKQSYHPWSRASLIGQTHSNRASDPAFQNQPNPYNSKCVPTDPATPHSSAMLIVLGDASVRSVVPSISPDTWNKACLPNDGNPLGPDWN
jgi:hypothetical protein